MGESRTTSIEMEMAELKLENQQLRSELMEIMGDEQIDRSLRDHISFYGMSGNDKKWSETADRVPGWLSTNLGGSRMIEWDNAIYRAHRGP